MMPPPAAQQSKQNTAIGSFLNSSRVNPNVSVPGNVYVDHANKFKDKDGV